MTHPAQPMSQFLKIEWVPKRWWLVEVTGPDGSYTPHRNFNPRPGDIRNRWPEDRNP